MAKIINGFVNFSVLMRDKVLFWMVLAAVLFAFAEAYFGKMLQDDD